MTGLHPDNPVGHPVFIQASDSSQRPLGTVQESGVINVIQLDTDTNKFYHVTETGRRLILPYDADN